MARCPASGPARGAKVRFDRGEDRRPARPGGRGRPRPPPPSRRSPDRRSGRRRAASCATFRCVAGCAHMLRVHRRRDEDRPVGREQHRRGEIVGEAVRHLRQEVGGRRRDDDRGRPRAPGGCGRSRARRRGRRGSGSTRSPVIAATESGVTKCCAERLIAARTEAPRPSGGGSAPAPCRRRCRRR